MAAKPELGYVISKGASGAKSFDDLCEAADGAAAAATDALVDDLPPAQRAAIWHVYLGCVWRFPRGNLEELLSDAREAIYYGLLVRGFA